MIVRIELYTGDERIGTFTKRYKQNQLRDIAYGWLVMHPTHTVQFVYADGHTEMVDCAAYIQYMKE